MARSIVAALAFWLLCLTLTAPAPAQAIEPRQADDWVEPMKRVHRLFKGEPNTVLFVGDSLTVSRALMTSFQWAKHESHRPYAAYLEAIRPHLEKQLAGSGWTTRNVLDSLPKALERYEPETVFLLIGTNDVVNGSLETFETNLSHIVGKCLANGSVVVMCTMPPRTVPGMSREAGLARVEAYNTVVREVARQKQVPLRDYYQAIMTRAPETWATTLLSDGVHPTAGETFDLTDANLNRSGYALLNKLTLDAGMAVWKKVYGRE